MRRLARLSIPLCLLAPVAGCGKDDQPGRSVTVAEGREVVVAGDEYGFDPETITAPPGEVVLTLDNAGNLAHNLEIHQGDVELAGTQSITKGRRSTIRLDVKPGEYRLVCTVGDHEELGMTGSLQVR